MRVSCENILLLVTALTILSGTSCGESTSEKAEQERLRSQVYFTRNDPGRWKEFAQTHEPQIKKISPQKIEVDVPFTTEAGHYIEVIVATDAAGREIASHSFARGAPPHAVLEIRAARTTPSLVIAKCNLHGMWRVPWPE